MPPKRAVWPPFDPRRRRRVLLDGNTAEERRRLVHVYSYLSRRAERHNRQAEQHTEEELVEALAAFPELILPSGFEKVRSGEALPPQVRAHIGAWVDALARQPSPPDVSAATHVFWLNALRSIAEGADPSTALRLKIAHNRPRREVHILAARDVWWLIHREGVRPGIAIARIASRYRLSVSAMRRFYYAHRGNLDVLFAR